MLLSEAEANQRVTEQPVEEEVGRFIEQRTELALTHPVELRVVDHGEVLGIPRNQNDETLPNLVFAFRQWDAVHGVLRVYVTRAYYEQWLRHDALHLAAIVDQEYVEQFIDHSHAQASDRMWRFRRSDASLPPPYAFYLFQLAINGEHDALAAIESTHPRDRAHIFSDYARSLLPSAYAVLSEKPSWQAAKHYLDTSTILQTAGPFTEALTALRVGALRPSTLAAVALVAAHSSCNYST